MSRAGLAAGPGTWAAAGRGRWRGMRGEWRGMPDALRAEWTKLRTVAGPAWLLAGVVVATVAVSAAADAATRCPAGQVCAVDTGKLTLTGVQLGQAVVAIMAVLVISNEYSTGMIRVTLVAMPRRLVVLTAKAGLVTGLVLAAGTVAVLGSVLAGRLMLPGHGFTAARGFTVLSLGDGPMLRAAAGSVLYLGLIALLSLGVAALVREPAVAIGIVLALLYLFPIIVGVAGADPHWQRHLEQIGPMEAGLAIQATTSLHNMPIGPWPGLGVLALWACAALVLGALSLRFRDA
jgi:ABC-2 type transport system permease protein